MKLRLPSPPPFSFRLRLAAGIVGLMLAVSCSMQSDAAKVRVLIIDGQNNHAWAVTTPLLRKILEDTGRFAVDVSTTPPGRPAAPRLRPEATPAQKAAYEQAVVQHAAALAEHERKAPQLWDAWRPRFADYAVIVSNYNGEAWPAEVRTGFAAHIRGGAGFVSYHAANNAFPDWPEYNEMIGVGGWGGRNEKSGPYLRLRAAQWIKDPTAGRGGSHGPQHEFVVEVQDGTHPIMSGLPPKWRHAKDELYDRLRGPAKNVTVLAAAFSDRTNEHEPILMVIPFGQGRVFHTTLGHAVDAVHGLGFQITFARGVEWAATGQVTLPAPAEAELPVERAALRPVSAP